jgi:CheY-like chemotaxis protein
MERMFIIREDVIQKLVADESIGVIDYPTDENLLEDSHFHDWIVRLFRTDNPTSLVIPLSLRGEKFLGLTLGLHIRLNHELIHNQRCIPIIFTSSAYTFETLFSDKDLEIKKSRTFPHYLLNTPNVFLEPETEPAVLKRIIAICKPITTHDYKNKVLDALKILPSEKTGKHSLANVWGIVRLAKTAGCLNSLQGNNLIQRKLKDLYFKYTMAYMLDEIKVDETNHSFKKNVSVKQKQILLVDDEANKGWDVIIKSIFHGSEVDVVARDERGNESFGSFYQKAVDKALELGTNNIPKWDLILLDLRLNEDEDLGTATNKPVQQHSGGMLLDKIKKANRGTQVIIFTASNKAWNMRQLLTMGADGYFIKESPELSMIDSFSETSLADFIITSELLISYSFLKNFYHSFKLIEQDFKPRRLPTHAKALPKEFIDEVLKWLELVNRNLLSNKNQIGLTTSFLMLFSILENISNRIIDSDNPLETTDQQGKKKYKFQFRSNNQELRSFVERPPQSGYYEKTNYSLESYRNLPWNMKIFNALDFLSSFSADMGKVNALVRKRNDIIHANATTGEVIRVEIDDLKNLFHFIDIGLRNIQ